MSYIHTGKVPIVLKNDPIDPDGKDWIFFSYGNWLRSGETITTHAATVTNGSLITDSVFLGTMVDEAGSSYDEVYGVKFSASSAFETVTVTHRVTTTTGGAVDLGRDAIDHSAVLSIRSL